MFKKLFSTLAGKNKNSQPSSDASVSPTPKFPVRWLSTNDQTNPFNVDGYDCLSFVRSRVASTPDPATSKIFNDLRKTTGITYTGELPQDPVEISITLEYPGNQVRDGILFKAGKMDEKWDIYLYGDCLYFCRSWTGALIYVAQFTLRENNICVGKIWLAREAATEDLSFAAQEVDYLLKSHLLQRRVPHPLPPDLRKDEETIGQYSYNQFGQMCCFGTYADTLPWDMLKHHPRAVDKQEK